MPRKIKNGSKVDIIDQIRYRFTHGAEHAGESGVVENLVESQSALYICFPNDEIRLYDLSEVVLK